MRLANFEPPRQRNILIYFASALQLPFGATSVRCSFAHSLRVQNRWLQNWQTSPVEWISRRRCCRTINRSVGRFRIQRDRRETSQRADQKYTHMLYIEIYAITCSIRDSPVSPTFLWARLCKQQKIPQGVAVAQLSPKKAGGVTLLKIS